MKIYKITEASDYLGVSINTLKTLANNGKIKSFKTTGEHRRFRQEDLDAYMGVSIIAGNIHIGVVSAPESIVFQSEVDKYIFKTADFDKRGTLWNNGCQLTLRGWDIFHYLHELSKEYGMPTHFYLGMPSKVGFEGFRVK